MTNQGDAAIVIPVAKADCQRECADRQQGGEDCDATILVRDPRKSSQALVSPEGDNIAGAVSSPSRERFAKLRLFALLAWCTSVAWPASYESGSSPLAESRFPQHRASPC